MHVAYQNDLAYIHDAGFGQFAAGAAETVIESLNNAGIRRGTVVDLGCGSGITLRLLCDAGFDVLGIDQSESMIELARLRVPEAEFRIDSFVTADIPSCVAVTAIGEVFNYWFDPANNDDARKKVWERIFQGLVPGGLLLFDMATPARAPTQKPYRTYFDNPEWAALVEVDVDDTTSILTRRITTFRKHEDMYRRDFEVHQLQLVDPSDVIESLQQTGFAIQTLDHYGAQPLPSGLVGFLAKKPT